MALTLIFLTLTALFGGGFAQSGNVDAGDESTPWHHERNCVSLSDVIFAIDSSSNIGKDNFRKAVDFAVSVSKFFNLGARETHFGAVVYSKETDKLFDLEDYTEHKELEEALQEADYLKEYADTGEALAFIKEKKLFCKKHGGRPMANRVVVLLTDGETKSFSEVLKAAENLKEHRVQIIVVSDQQSLFGPQLEQIASSSDDVFGYSVRDVVSRIRNNATQICEREEFVIPEPDVKEACPKTADVILALDASHKLGKNTWDNIVVFMSAFVTNFTIGEGNVRFGAIVFSSGKRIIKLFDLEDHESQESLVEALQTAELMYGIHNDDEATHKALEYIDHHDLFKSSAGGRKKAPDTVVIVTDGLSDHPDKTQHAADKLKKKGVNIISIGTGITDAGPADDEVADMASPEKVFYLEDLDALERAQGEVEFRTCGGNHEE